MNSRVARYDYAPAPSGATFAVLEINSAAGHAWPNASPTPADTAEVSHNGFKNQDIQAEAVLWDFLKKTKRIITRAK
jgi:poly(3-hydroxybutyrate) depolymerase